MPEFPEMIGKYKIEGIVAKGGMGVVYRSKHPSLGRPVVIKKMTARKNSSNLERFKREAQILLDLQNPNIVHLFDYFTEGSYRYMVEELVDGMAVDKLLEKQTSLSPQIALLILQDACKALKYAHSKDIVHRDIKPGNILISKNGVIKLADFGIASDKAESQDPSITQSGVALGTPAYMPPEQFEDSAKVDRRADIYALGIMLYEMITGSKPYPGTLSIETLNTIKKGKYIPPTKLAPKTPQLVSRLIRKMLRPKANQRFQSVDPILAAIKRYFKHYDVHEVRVNLARMILSKTTFEEKPYIPVDKKRNQILCIVASCALALGVFGGLWYQGIIHKSILRFWYTPVKLEMLMPATSSINLDLPVRAYFFENDANDIPEVPGSARVFQAPKNVKSDGKTSSKYKYFTAKDVCLRPGDYRVKLVAGPYVWWKSFTVGKKDYRLNCDFLKDMRRKLTVIPSSYDAVTGKNITEKTSVSVNYNGIWTPISEVPAEKILSNTVWKFRFRCEGYKDEIFSLRFDWYQDELYVSANLNPAE